MHVEQVAGPYTGAADGPLWDGEALLFTLVGESRVMRYHPGTGRVVEYRRYTNNTSGLAFDGEGRLYGCESGGCRVVRFNSDGSTSMLADRLDGRLHNQPDDLVVDAAGRIWFSDPAPASFTLEPPVDHASVLRLEHDSDGAWHIQRMTFDTVFPTAITLSADEQMLYVAENPEDDAVPSELRAYSVLSDGTLGPPAVVQSFEPRSGVRGMCIDADGNPVACLGTAIAVFSPSGELLVSHPFERGGATNCAFGGPRLDTLYVTTEDGQLYRIRDMSRR